MSKGENIVKWIKGQRISWLGHLERMEEDRMPKKDFTQELEGTRSRGRPRKRREEEVERDLQVLGVRRWRELVADMKKMEGHCSTDQSPQWAVVPMEEDEKEEVSCVTDNYKKHIRSIKLSFDVYSINHDSGNMFQPLVFIFRPSIIKSINKIN